MSDEKTIGRFLRGLTIGALIGAVIAGSRLWSGRRAPSRATAERDATGAPEGEAPVVASGRQGRP